MKGMAAFCVVCLYMFECHCYSFGSDIVPEFIAYINKYKKPYVEQKWEMQRRYTIFKENVMRHEQLNDLTHKLNDSATYGINKFSDLTPQEFQEGYLSRRYAGVLDESIGGEPPIHLLSLPGDESQMSTLPKRVDWRDKKIITKVKNQKSCGGCWAYSSVEAVESMHALRTGELEVLSTQQVIDCSYAYKGYLFGCKGGDTCTALNWMNSTKVQLIKESAYHDLNKAEACKLLSNKTVGITVTGFTCNNYVHNESAMLRSLALWGPVVVSVDSSNWQSYLGGVIRFHCGQQANNHAVLVVGYDTTGDVPFYIVKNSWGEDFGDNGYIYIGIGNNTCGIAKEVSTVQV